jgi:AcrR family transcriptional regulator
MSRRLEILRRATEIFERQGVSRTSIEDIANAVGVKREAIYYYFKSRNDILAEIILPSSTALLVGLRNIMRSDRPSREKLRAAIEAHLSAFSPSYLEMTVALREVHFSGGDDKLNELKKVWTEYGELWTDLIREGQANGSFKAGVNPKMASFGVLGMCNWLSRWYQPGKGMTIADITDTFFTMLADGLASGTSITPPSA